MAAEYKTRDGVTMIEGLEAVRRRPEIYVGNDKAPGTASSRMLELIVMGFERDTPKPSAMRVYVWQDAVTVAIDGKPLSVEPFAKGTSEVPHPALYQFFMSLVAGGEGLGRTLAFGGVLNALSERLIVSTMHGELRYRAVFSRGCIVSLLSKQRSASPLGNIWLTYRRDDTKIIGPALTADDAKSVAARCSVPVAVYDRSAEEPDWY